jgi:flagellar assembly protein FliH
MSERARLSDGIAPAPWVLPAVKGPLVAQQGRSGSAAALEAEQRQAWTAGFEQGRREGLAAGSAQVEARQHELDAAIGEVGQLLQSLGRPLERLDEMAATELARLALATGTQLARRELRHVRVHLHPADAAIVRERLAQPAAERAWSVVEDPVLARGGCRVITDASQVDGRFDSRVAAVVATVLGDEREHDRADDAVAGGGAVGAEPAP